MGRRLLALAVFLSTVSLSATPSDVSLGKWWQPEPLGYKHALELSDEQAAHIEGTFQSFLPELTAAFRDFTAAESALDAKLSEEKADELTLEDAAGRMEIAKRSLAVVRQTLRYRTRRLLTPPQRAKLESIRAHVAAQPRRSSR